MNSDNHSSNDLKFYTAPNVLTLLRVAFVPVVIGMLYKRTAYWDLIAAVTFGVASITDYFDGYIARLQKQESVYGKLMDPLADKFLVVSSVIMLQELNRIHPIVVMVLICREMAITGLRALASAEGVVIAASSSAKWKTATQMFAIPFLMVSTPPWGIPFFQMGQVLLYISLGISLWSAKDYIVTFFKDLKKTRSKRTMKRKIARENKLASRAKRFALKSMRKKTDSN